MFSRENVVTGKQFYVSLIANGSNFYKAVAINPQRPWHNCNHFSLVNKTLNFNQNSRSFDCSIRSMRFVIKYFLHANNKHFYHFSLFQKNIFQYFHFSFSNRSFATMFARCRVDFQKTPTKNCRINLSVLGKFSIWYLNQIKQREFIRFNLKQISWHFSFLLFCDCSVPPTHLEIFSDQGSVLANSVIGPYKEGSSVNITCMSSGGKCLKMLLRMIQTLHTITSSSSFYFLYDFYGQICIMLLYIWWFLLLSWDFLMVFLNRSHSDNTSNSWYSLW